MTAASFDGLDLISARSLAVNRVTEMSDMVTELAGERHVAAVWMHSGTDYMGIGPWANGRLLRAVSMSSADGIIENVGEPLSFEAPFWEGRRPVIHLSNYPLPFHPLGMGSEALRELFLASSWRGGSTQTVSTSKICRYPRLRR